MASRPRPTSVDRITREHLLELLRGGGAHLDFDVAVADLPADLRGRKPRGLPHSPWRLVEHMRIAQHDILQFSKGPGHDSPPWPDGYWPTTDAPPSEAAWARCLADFRDDAGAMRALVADAKVDLFARLPWGEGQTVLREAMLLADHNAYHLGQLVTVRRLLGAWHD